MFKRILVAVDGSDTGEPALQEAIKLAKEFPAELPAQLRIVHAVDAVSLNWDAEFASPVEIWDAMTKGGHEILSKAGAGTADPRKMIAARFGEGLASAYL